MLMWIKSDVNTCNRTPAGRKEAAEQLAAILANCSVEPTVLPGFERIKPKPPRTRRVDPETRLRRKKHSVPAAIAQDLQRARLEHEQESRLSAIADEFCGEEHEA